MGYNLLWVYVFTALPFVCAYPAEHPLEIYTKKRTFNFTGIWHVEYFETFDLGVGYWIESDDFYTNGVLNRGGWKLRLYPQGHTADAAGYISLEADLRMNRGAIAQLTYSVIDSRNQKFYSQRGLKLQSENIENEKTDSLPNFISLTDFYQDRSRFLPQGTLTIISELEVMLPATDFPHYSTTTPKSLSNVNDDYSLL